MFPSWPTVALSADATCSRFMGFFNDTAASDIVLQAEVRWELFSPGVCVQPSPGPGVPSSCLHAPMFHLQALRWLRQSTLRAMARTIDSCGECVGMKVQDARARTPVPGSCALACPCLDFCLCAWQTCTRLSNQRCNRALLAMPRHHLASRFPVKHCMEISLSVSM